MDCFNHEDKEYLDIAIEALAHIKNEELYN